MNSRFLKLTTAIPLFFLVLGLTATSNLAADESARFNKVDRSHIKQKHKKSHSTRGYRHKGNRSRRHYESGDHYSSNRHHLKHRRGHRGHKHNYHYDHRGYKRYNHYRPRSGFTYYSNNGYWNNDRLDFIIRYRGYD